MTDTTTRAAALLEQANLHPVGEGAANKNVTEVKLPKKIEAIIKNWGEVGGVYTTMDDGDKEMLAVHMEEFALYNDSFDKLDQLKKLGLDMITTDDFNEMVTEDRGVLLVFYGDAYK